MDLVEFTQFKRVLIVLVEDGKFSAALHGESFHGVFAAACFDAETTVFGKGLLRRGFEHAGICPWDEERILDRLEEELGRVTDPNSSLVLAVEATKDIISSTKRPARAEKMMVPVELNTPYEESEFAKLLEERRLAKRHKAKAKAKAAKEKEKKGKEQAKKAERKKIEKQRRTEERKEEELQRARENRKKVVKRVAVSLARERKKRHKEAERDKNRCKLCPGVGRIWRSSGKWLECEKFTSCGYTQCPGCTALHPSAMIVHESECWRKGA